MWRNVWILFFLDAKQYLSATVHISVCFVTDVWPIVPHSNRHHLSCADSLQYKIIRIVLCCSVHLVAYITTITTHTHMSISYSFTRASFLRLVCVFCALLHALPYQGPVCFVRRFFVYFHSVVLLFCLEGLMSKMTYYCISALNRK